MKRLSKKAKSWLVAAAGFLLAMIAWGIYKATAVVYGPPPVKGRLYGPPPSDYIIKNDSILSQVPLRPKPHHRDRVRERGEDELGIRACIYGPPRDKKPKKESKRNKRRKSRQNSNNKADS